MSRFRRSFGRGLLSDELVEHLQAHGIPADAGTGAADDADDTHTEEDKA